MKTRTRFPRGSLAWCSERQNTETPRFVAMRGFIHQAAKQVQKVMAPHSSPLAWKTRWTEGSCGLQSMVSRRVRHDWATSLSLFTFMHWRRKWQPTPVFLPGTGEPGGLPSMGSHGVGHDWSDLAAAKQADGRTSTSWKTGGSGYIERIQNKEAGGSGAGGWRERRGAAVLRRRDRATGPSMKAWSPPACRGQKACAPLAAGGPIRS